MSTLDEDMKKYLDEEFERMATDVGERGMPSCYLLFEMEAPLKPVGVPLAVFGMKNAVYENFERFVDATEKPVGIVAWWFDD